MGAKAQGAILKAVICLFCIFMAISANPYFLEENTMKSPSNNAQAIEKNILKNGLEDAEFIAHYMSEAAFAKSKALSDCAEAGGIEVHQALEGLNVSNRLASRALNVYRVLQLANDLANDKAQGIA